MQHLGQTRSTKQSSHLLHTPDTFIRAALPGMERAAAVVHASPALGASFSEYTVEFEAGGIIGPTTVQRFLYVLDGELAIELPSAKHILAKNGYAYLPPGTNAHLTTTSPARIEVIEKTYKPLPNAAAPELILGEEQQIPSQPILGDEALQVRTLLPNSMSYDFAVNTMQYQPGAALPMVEVHVMEHGLLMLEGGGIYRLDNSWYPVTEGDFIWMGPYCPQWFGALGKKPAKYLLYKDWNRDPLL